MLGLGLKLGRICQLVWSDYCVYFDTQNGNKTFQKYIAIDFETPRGFQKRLEIREKFFLQKKKIV